MKARLRPVAEIVEDGLGASSLGIEQATFDALQAKARVAIKASAGLRRLWLAGSSSSGLVMASAVVDALACRVMGRSGSDLILSASPWHWYSAYCSVLCEYSAEMQKAVRAGKLTLRNESTRVAMKGGNVRRWLDADLGALYRSGPFAPGNHASLLDDSTRWIVSKVLPPGAIKASEAEEWLVAEGLAEPGELPRLLGLSLPEEAASGGDDQAAPAVEEAGGVAPTTWRELVKFRTGKKGTGFKSEEKRIVANEKARRSNQPGAKGVAAAMAKELDISVTLLNGLVRAAPKADWADPVNGNRKGADKAA